MADMLSTIDAIADLVAGLAPPLEKWRRTSQGKNPWTASALVNVLTLEPYFLRAIELVGASHTSCYRHPLINKAVGGVDDSRHPQGAAIDIIPRAGFTVETAAQALLDTAQAGKLGPVREIIPERKRGVVHVDWFTDGAKGKPRKVEDERF